MLRYTLFILTSLFFNSIVSFGQGCSDAGFCTMGAMKPDQPYNKKVPIRLRSMEVSFYRGTTTISPIVYSATLDATFSLFKGEKTSLQVKLPYMAVTGNFGDTNGIGDISLCLTRSLYSSEKFDINLSVGGKIPSNNSDLESTKAEFEGLPLPMYYQTSLGTYDAIIGISLITRKWLFATGIQHPFNQNDNQFAWQDRWDDVYPSMEYLEKNTNSIELKRGTDVMLRVERNFRFSRLNFSLGALPIFRITNDETTDWFTKERVKPEGAKGLALSVIGTAGYNFNVRNGIKLLVGHKIIQRETNPDGLTRHLVTTFSYYYRF